MDISQIRVNPNNPRTIKDDKFKKLVKSIKENPEFLDARPIVVKDNIIYGGNMRWLALKETGIEIKPEWIKDVTGWTDEAIRKFIVVDNIPYGDNDWDLLANQYEKEELEDWGMDVDKWTDDEVIEDEVPEVSTEEPKSKLGEIYQLGRHRVMCGDSTKIEDVERLMDGKKADMVFTDPPYNVAIDSRSKKNGIGKIENDDMDDESFMVFLIAVFTNLSLYSNENSPAYIWHSYRKQIVFENSLKNSGYEVRNQIIWVKDIPSYTNVEYRQKHENLFYCNKVGKTCNFYEKQKDSVFEVPSIQSAKSKNDSGKEWFKGGNEGLNLHTTQKPIGVITIPLSTSSKQDDIVLDLFLGSGSTLIACEQTNRICYGCEIDPKYVDVIRKRYAKFIGKEEEWETITPKLAT